MLTAIPGIRLPPCQINWWLPIYEIESDNAMAFHPRYWTQPVKNSSSDYNYYIWNKHASRGERGKADQRATRVRCRGRLNQWSLIRSFV